MDCKPFYWTFKVFRSSARQELILAECRAAGLVKLLICHGDDQVREVTEHDTCPAFARYYPWEWKLLGPIQRANARKHLQIWTQDCECATCMKAVRECTEPRRALPGEL